jgi:hypothetical protein
MAPACMAVAPIRSGTLDSLIVMRRRPVTTHTIEMAQINGDQCQAQAAVRRSDHGE